MRRWTSVPRLLSQTNCEFLQFVVNFKVSCGNFLVRFVSWSNIEVYIWSDPLANTIQLARSIFFFNHVKINYMKSWVYPLLSAPVKSWVSTNSWVNTIRDFYILFWVVSSNTKQDFLVIQIFDTRGNLSFSSSRKKNSTCDGFTFCCKSLSKATRRLTRSTHFQTCAYHGALAV